MVCGSCGATRMKALRLGVSRVREDLEALTGVEVAEVWGPAAADEGEAERVRRSRIVVGTEAALHRVRDADVVVFLEFDSELLAPRFRAAEQALALLARAARLVAETPRARTPTVSPTGRPGASSSRRASLDTLPSWPRCRPIPGCWPRRSPRCARALGLPPFSALAVVSGPAADAYGAALREAAPVGVEVSGPVDGAWSVRAPDHRTLCDLLASVPRPAGRVRVEVDPVRA